MRIDYDSKQSEILFNNAFNIVAWNVYDHTQMASPLIPLRQDFITASHIGNPDSMRMRAFAFHNNHKVLNEPEAVPYMQTLHTDAGRMVSFAMRPETVEKLHASKLNENVLDITVWVGNEQFLLYPFSYNSEKRTMMFFDGQTDREKFDDIVRTTAVFTTETQLWDKSVHKLQTIVTQYKNSRYGFHGN
jgi:hypothetical protein